MMPISRDAMLGSDILFQLSVIYMLTSEYSKAIDNLEILLSNPAWITVQELKSYTFWDSLRDHTRFQELIAKYSD